MLPTLVNALVAIDFTRVSARVFVVKLAQTGSIEMRCDTKHPRGGDGVQRLGTCVNILSGKSHFLVYCGEWEYVQSCGSGRGVRLPWLWLCSDLWGWSKGIL